MKIQYTSSGIGYLDSRYLSITNNLSDLDNVATARTSLGLVAGGSGDIWVKKAGDTMVGSLTMNGGNIVMSGTETVDGVDISAHASSSSAHHAPVTLGTNTATALSLSGQQLSLGDVFMQNTGDTSTGQIFIDGSSDQIQLRLQGHSTQTSNIATWENSSGTILGYITGAGLVGVPSGSGGSLGLHFSGDTNTGIYDESGGDRLSLVANGQGGLTFNGTSGAWRVGMGLVDPAYPVHIWAWHGTRGLYLVHTGGKTDHNYGMYVDNQSTSSTASKNKYGLYLTSTGTWNGTSAVNYGLYIPNVTGGTTNYAMYTNTGDVRFGDDVILDGADNDKIWFGAGRDASIYYDGTDMKINPKAVGSGILDILGTLQVDGYNSADGSAGVGGSFTTADGKTVTVKNGIITVIV